MRFGFDAASGMRWLAALWIAVGMLPAALAQPGGIDRDGDGMISRDEAAARPELLRRFDTLDTNGDGKLDMQELTNAPHEPRVKPAEGGLRGKLKAADTDGDGQLSQDELRAAGQTALLKDFPRLDRNHDGMLSPSELPSARRGDKAGKSKPKGKRKTKPKAKPRD